MHDAIETPRLALVPLGAAFLRASLAGERTTAEAILGARLPAVWPQLADVLEMRLRQLGEAPDDAPWLTRAIVLTSQTRCIGVTGFHGRPGGAWLHDYTHEGVEFGYTIFDEADRRRGYASEAGAGLVRWASEQHGVRHFVLSMKPENQASRGVARKLAFHKVGEWVHEKRGLEHVYLRSVG